MRMTPNPLLGYWDGARGFRADHQPKPHVCLVSDPRQPSIKAEHGWMQKHQRIVEISLRRSNPISDMLRDRSVSAARMADLGQVEEVGSRLLLLILHVSSLKSSSGLSGTKAPPRRTLSKEQFIVLLRTGSSAPLRHDDDDDDNETYKTSPATPEVSLRQCTHN